MDIQTSRVKMVTKTRLNGIHTCNTPDNRVMGNNTTSVVLHEEDEPPLKTDSQGYEIRSLVTDTNHRKDDFGRPVIIFDRWKILQSDLKDKQDKMGEVVFVDQTSPEHSTNHEHHSQVDIGDGFQELSTSCAIQPFTEEKQKANAASEVDSRGSFVKKSRPNSLAILSRSHDFIHTLGDKEVGPGDTPNSVLNTEKRATSADTVLQAPLNTNSVGLQQRRNQRPTSLLIPNILHIPPEPSRTAPYVTTTHHDLSFTRRSPPVRQRSYSMPSSAYTELHKDSSQHLHSLDEALFLLSKKKIAKTEIDEQSLLHRAADAGHVKLVKKCIQAGCCTAKTLDSLNGASALHCAARADKNSAQIVKLLLESGVDVNAKNYLGETAIFSAVIHKNTETTDLLVEHGCDINSVWQESTPIYLMIDNKSVESTFKAINKGAQITELPDTIRQPLHAVLDLCHMQAITYPTMQLLKLMVQADGNVVEHLQNYKPNKPGCSEQDIVYHIYRMERGPTQNEGKQLVRSLVKLGYTPSRGELSTIGQSDEDYDYLYSYIKHGPSPLKDLCVRAIRQACSVNVPYTLNLLTETPETERRQILLQPVAPAEHEYENVQVFKQPHDMRKSKHKSLKNIMNGIGRLSRRFSKKQSKVDGDITGMSQLSLPSRELSKRISGSLPANMNQKPKIAAKPKFTKREPQKAAAATAVADIVRRYSSSESNIGIAIGDENETQDPQSAVDNPAYVHHDELVQQRENHADRAAERHVSCITLQDDDSSMSDEDKHADEEVTVKFNSDAVPLLQSTDRRLKNADGGQLTPIHPPDNALGMGLAFTAYKGSIHIDDEEERM